MAYNNGIELRLLVNGRPMREYSHKGSTFYESRSGTNYTIKIKNDNGYRVMAVLSVDGLDVITGKSADEADKGYILDAYSAIEIKGYRISDENSAAFVFTSKGKSYVQNVKGDARNSGVIGVRVFKEKYVAPPAPAVIHKHHHHYQPQPYYVYPWNPYPVYPDVIYSSTSATITTGGNTSNVTYGACGATGVDGTVGTGGTTTAYNVSVSNTGGCSATSDNGLTRDVTKRSVKMLKGTQLCSAASNSSFDAPISYKQFDTGTAWGKKLDDRVRREHFVKDSLLTEIVVYYASESGLTDMGIDLNDTPRMAEEDKMPKAFNSKYCQPPKGWVG